MSKNVFKTMPASANLHPHEFSLSLPGCQPNMSTNKKEIFAIVSLPLPRNHITTMTTKRRGIAPFFCNQIFTPGSLISMNNVPTRFQSGSTTGGLCLDV